ncbi:uncharacterized protein C12orf56 homolog isoform X2 [Liolophura sinensis]
MSSLHAGGSRPSSQNSLRDKLHLGKKSKKPLSSADSTEDLSQKTCPEIIEEERLEDIEECDLFDRSHDSYPFRKADDLPSARLREKDSKFVKNGSAGIQGKRREPPKCPEIITSQPSAHTSRVWPTNNTAEKDKNGCCLFGLCQFKSNSHDAAFAASGSKSRLKRNSIGPLAASELDVDLNKEAYSHRDDISEIIEMPNTKSSLSSHTLMDGTGRDALSPHATPLPSSRISTPLLNRSRNTTPFGDQSQDGRSLLMVPDLASVNGDFHSSLISGDKRIAVLNIYLLSLSSPMLMLIRSAWNNFMIRATLMMDAEFEKNAKAGAVRATYNQVEKMEVLFIQLKRELFRPDNSLEDIYDLSNELRIASERNFVLKKIFWKNSDMFPYYVHVIQSYVPTSRTNLNTVNGRKQRHEEIELVILLTQIISIMFRETELIPARFQTLKSQRGKAVLDLLRVLTCQPEIPEKQVAPSGRAAELIQSFQDEGYSSASATEVTKLLGEFTDVSMTTVFELFLMARQANWNHNSDNFLNIFWMVQVLEELSTTEKYVERVIQQAMALISPSQVEQLSPAEAVKLYQQFSVILIFLSYSPRVTFFIRNNYMEEFKYFVQPAVVERKLSSSFPITRDTIKLIEDVLSKVLDVPGVNLSITPR